MSWAKTTWWKKTRPGKKNHHRPQPQEGGDEEVSARPAHAGSRWRHAWTPRMARATSPASETRAPVRTLGGVG